MAIKQIIVIPIYWGEWWQPSEGNTYSWLDLSGFVQAVLSSRYMDGLNQYGIGRGFVSGFYVFPINPPSTGFYDDERDAVFRFAINNGYVSSPDDYDLDTQLPFYCLIVKPGVQHVSPLDPPGTVAYHYGFPVDQQGNALYWDGGSWPGGQVCWVMADSTSSGTVQRLIHEMAEAYVHGFGEISDRCQAAGPVLVNGVLVPQYWSEADSSCWPPADSTVAPDATTIGAAVGALAGAAGERPTRRVVKQQPVNTSRFQLRKASGPSRDNSSKRRSRTRMVRASHAQQKRRGGRRKGH